MLLNNSITDLSQISQFSSLGKKDNQLSQDDFIKILLTQMRLQTPQNPFDSNTMMQQMAQLTNLTATKDMEAAVKSLNTNLNASQVLNASQLIGKKVEVANEFSPLIAGEGLKGSVSLPDDAEQVSINIYDLNNKLIKTIELGSHPAGLLDFSWDGMDKENKLHPPGLYKISATNMKDGKPLALATNGTFQVRSVATDKKNQGVLLNLDGLGKINMKDLIKIL